MKIYRISILIGYTVFLTSEENRIVILLTTWPGLGKERNGIWPLCLKEEEFNSPIKNMKRKKEKL